MVTSYHVLQEIRDKRAREKLDALPFEIESGECSDKSLNYIKNFAIKTGDFASLSMVDMELIAVAYEYCIENGKGDFLRKEPPAPLNL